MLEATDAPIEAIANEVGYEDAGFFARLFRRNVDLTPGQYRKRFGAVRRALQKGRMSGDGRSAEPALPYDVASEGIDDAPGNST